MVGGWEAKEKDVLISKQNKSVILSGEDAARSAASAESKDPEDVYRDECWKAFSQFCHVLSAENSLTPSR